LQQLHLCLLNLEFWDFPWGGNMKNKILWSFAIVLFIGSQVGVGIGYHAVANYLEEVI